MSATRAIRPVALFLAVVSASLHASAAEPRRGEGLEVSRPPGWVVHHDTHTAVLEEVFLVPPGQEGTGWRDMVVFREVKNMGRANPRAVLEQSVTEARAGCPDLVTRPIQEGRVNGYPGAFLLVGCPGGKDGQGEVNLVKVVAGNTNLYMVQRTWRVPAFTLDAPPVDSRTLDIWTRYLSMQKPCDMDTSAHPCEGQGAPQ